jgi:lysylphosphatidylglycerol synthetase-like protein (DUF2156 family)
MEENLNQKNSPDKKNKIEARILGVNLLVLAAYSVLAKLSGRGLDGSITDAVFIAFHLCACLIIAAVKQSWSWVLSGLLVLAIGFATCAEIVSR